MVSHISLYSSFRTFSRFEQGVILSFDDLVKNSLCFLPYYGLTFAFSHELWEFSAHRSNFLPLYASFYVSFLIHRKLAWDRGCFVLYMYITWGEVSSVSNKYKSYMMESFSAYMKFALHLFQISFFQQSKVYILFYSILFYSILFYSILFYSILYGKITMMFYTMWTLLYQMIYFTYHVNT
jgi:hypothetical protein